MLAHVTRPVLDIIVEWVAYDSQRYCRGQGTASVPRRLAYRRPATYLYYEITVPFFSVY